MMRSGSRWSGQPTSGKGAPNALAEPSTALAPSPRRSSAIVWDTPRRKMRRPSPLRRTGACRSSSWPVARRSTSSASVAEPNSTQAPPRAGLFFAGNSTFRAAAPGVGCVPLIRELPMPSSVAAPEKRNRQRKPPTAYDLVGRLAAFGIEHPWQVPLLMPHGYDDFTAPAQTAAQLEDRPDGK